MDKIFQFDKQELDELYASMHNTGIVVVTIGVGGKLVFSWAQESGIPVCGICDNDNEKIGSVVGALTVLSVEEAVNKFGNSSYYLVASYDVVIYHQLYIQMQTLGIIGTRILHLSLLENRWHVFNWKQGQISQILEGSKEKILSVANMFEDKHSRNVYLKMLARFAHGYCFSIPDEYRSPVGYFYHDFFELHDREVLIQGGVYHGETIDEFIDVYPDYEAIYGFEADDINYKHARENVHSEKTTLVLGAICDSSDEMSFLRTGHTSSMLAHGGGTSVQGVRIDDFCRERDIAPTIIQMDIEGAEMSALHGARDTIMKYKPKLAICLYHSLCFEHVPLSDYWEIPIFVREIVPEYSFYVRNDSLYSDNLQTVLYAVKKS